MQYKLDKNEIKLMQEIDNSFYMQPTINRIIACIKLQKNKNQAWIDVFNKIHAILIDAKNDVEKILQ